jgi:serine/threonine protein kinase
MNAEFRGMSHLVTHGFLDIELEPGYTNICEILPNAREIARLGIPQTINGQEWRFLDRSLVGDGVYVGWCVECLHDEGTYGKIYTCHRMVVKRRADGLFDVIEKPRDMILKRTEAQAGSDILTHEDTASHTSEALLHVLAWQTMSTTVCPWSIPQPYEVFGDYVGGSGLGMNGWKTMSLCMSYVSGRTMYSHFQKTWKSDTQVENTRAFLNILAQIAFILHHLQVSMRLNHRDLKVNNVMVNRRRDPVVLELDGIVMASPYEITLIDFGFACVGCPPPKAPVTVFQAGSWFPLGDLCCKAGRDIAQLLFCIHCYFPIEEFLVPEIATVVREWLQIPWSGGVADALNGFTKDGRPARNLKKMKTEFNTGIYEFLRRSEVDPVTCAPIAIFRACHSLNALI